MNRLNKTNRLIDTKNKLVVARVEGEGDGTPLQCSCLENSADRGAWWAVVHGVATSWT